MFAVVVPPGSEMGDVLMALFLLFLVSMVIFWGYGVLFSTARAVSIYQRSRRWIEGGFAAMFGLAGFKVFTSRFV